LTVFASPYFDQDAFTHHALLVLGASASEIVNHRALNSKLV